MAWFPMFTQLAGKHCLIVGGGKVAARKAGTLLEFGARLTVIAPRIDESLRGLPGVSCREEAFDPAMIPPDCFLLAAASNDRSVNHRAVLACRQRGIPVNAADSREESSFLFPAILSRGPLTIGVSTSGASPDGAAALRDRIADLIPPNIEDILTWLDDLRPALRQRYDADQRRRAYRELLAHALAAGHPLIDEEVNQIIEACAPIDDR